MRAGALVRVSTDEQELENQRLQLSELAAERGWELTWYEERGVSGAAKRRPELARLVEDARRRRIRVVCVAALDRLGRSMVDVILTVKTLDEYGCAVVSLREPWLDTTGPARGLLVAAFGWVAEQELQLISTRTKVGMRRAREHGTRTGKPIGRPRASQLLLGAGTRHVQQGSSLRKAAGAAGVSVTSLRRHHMKLALEDVAAGDSQAVAARRRGLTEKALARALAARRSAEDGPPRPSSRAKT